MGLTTYELANHLSVVAPQIYIAGGAIRDVLLGKATPTKDFDIFFSDGKDVWPVKQHLEQTLGYTTTYECPLGELLVLKHAEYPDIQLVSKQMYSSAQELIESFPWTVTMCALDVSTGSIVTGPQTVEDIQHKRLRINKLHHVVANLRHMQKYLAYGYTPVPGFWQALHKEILRIGDTPDAYNYQLD